MKAKNGNIEERQDIPDLWKTAELMKDAAEIITATNDTQRERSIAVALMRQADDVVAVWTSLHKHLPPTKKTQTTNERYHRDGYKVRMVLCVSTEWGKGKFYPAYSIELISHSPSQDDEYLIQRFGSMDECHKFCMETGLEVDSECIMGGADFKHRIPLNEAYRKIREEANQKTKKYTETEKWKTRNRKD